MVLYSFFLRKNHGEIFCTVICPCLYLSKSATNHIKKIMKNCTCIFISIWGCWINFYNLIEHSKMWANYFTYCVDQKTTKLIHASSSKNRDGSRATTRPETFCRSWFITLSCSWRLGDDSVSTVCGLKV